MITLRGKDITPVLHLAHSDENSLYTIVSKTCDDVMSELTKGIDSFIHQGESGGHVKFDSSKTHRHLDFSAVFERISSTQGSFLDGAICERIERSHPNSKILFSELLNSPCQTAQEFCAKLRSYVAQIRDFYIARNDISALIESYENRDIAQLLCTTGALNSPELCRRRFISTGRIMRFFMQENHIFIIVLALNMMHLKRFLAYKSDTTQIPYYNQGSILFTHLTICARNVPGDVTANPSVDQTPWYVYWKIFGSLMGLSFDVLPNNHIEATQLITQMKTSPLCAQTPERAQLMQTLRSAMP